MIRTTLRPSSMRRAALLLVLATAALGTRTPAEAACQLNSSHGSIQHVIYIQFDNTHFRRDNPNVPSDLEQMPSLLSFIKGNGTLLTNDHTVLISHTAGGILSSLTGVYPDRHGQTVSNSYVRTSNTGGFSFPSSFGYWTDSVSATGTPTVSNMVTPTGANVPAPWVPFTRAGCDVGAIASANIVLENTGTGANGDITKIYGSGSPEWNEAVASSAAAPNTAARQLAQTDFVGIAIHCGAGGGICTGNAHARPDLLPDEPGGYSGFLGLFGAKYVNPQITAGAATVKDTSGNSITGPFGQPGFPGFDGMSAAASLGYVLQMQQAGIPVTFAYISDAHDFHGVAGNQHTAFGPGSAGYVQQLQAYDAAFATFFDRLTAAGITRNNTLFVFTVDEGDHFVGVAQTNCDGVTTPCVYGPNQVGEINANIDTLVAGQFPSLNTKFLAAGAPYALTVHGDDAPPFYLAKRGVGPLGQTDPVTREFEQTIATLTAVNPYTLATDRLLVQMADQTGMKALHMLTAGDPARNATFVFFADPNYFITDFLANTCLTCINPAFAWNHGDIQPEIANTWLGFVGPGVLNAGQDDQTWSDHTDIRPTILSLLGLGDSYVHDGRVLIEAIETNAQPVKLRGHQNTLADFVSIFKQINAPFGEFGLNSLKISTAALGSTAANDAVYTSLEQKISGWTVQRDTIASQMKSMLDGATFNGNVFNEPQAKHLISQAQALLSEVKSCADDTVTCAQ